MDIPDNSRVTVECHDPSGVFPLVQDQLLKRLPLRNLKWKAASRPLRQIDALHVDFGSHDAPIASPNVSARPDLNRRSMTTPAGDRTHERRHQIPGLRQTPYVKVYLLRCDDKETYKSKARKLVQAWISDNSPPTQSTTALNKHQYHDACDLLILHVVMPGTVAASEPRWSQHSSQDSDELAERSKRTPWPTKSGTTVLDKIRTDFSIHARNDFDRVAQVRLQKLPTALPTASTIPSYPESPQEQAQAWQDFMSKLKTSILHSFDLRVSQYEDDIREKEAQRSLPGWNFCTFFTLKEGLARGFESVGLVEDSLAVHRELSVGLDAVAREDTTLLGDMSRLKDTFIELLRDNDQSLVDRLVAMSTRPLDLNTKEYRNMIVSSTISIFDFKAYLFMREKALLYRIAGFEQRDGSDQAPSMSLVSDVCAKAAAFVTSNMRVFRHELLSGQHEPGQDYIDLMNAVCASWAFATIEQILKDTDAVSTDVSEAVTLAKPNASRKGSLAVKPDDRPRSRSGHDDVASSAVTPVSDPSLAELIAGRADLFLLQRRILESLAERRSWYAGLIAVEKARRQLIEPVSRAEIASVCSKVLTPSLATAMASMTTFQTTYETLSESAVRHYLLAGRPAAAEALLGNIALLKFQLGDYSGAVQHLQRVTSHSMDAGLDPVQMELLKTHALCLKKLNRRDEFIRISLKTLHTDLDGDLDAGRIVNDIVEISQQLTYDYVVPFDEFFSKREIRPYMEHFPDRDGFFVRFVGQCRYKTGLVFDEISLKILDADGSGQDVILKSGGPVSVEHGYLETILQSNVSTCGQFVFDSLVLQIHKLHLVHNFQRKEKQTAFAFANTQDPVEGALHIREPSIVCFPRKDSLQAQLSMTPEIQIGQRRSLRLHITTGSGLHRKVGIRLRPASAGLRLYSSDARIVLGSVTPIDAANVMSFEDIKPDTSFAIEMPYALETVLPEIKIKLAIDYTTDAGTSTFVSTQVLISALALDVEVHDIFKAASLFSRFRIRTTDGLPLFVDSATLSDSARHAVEGCPQADELTVLEQQPLSLCYRITRKAGSSQPSSPLKLDITYRRLDDMVVGALSRRFVDSLSLVRLASLERLLVPYFEGAARAQMSAELLESALMNDALRVPTFEALEWPKLIRAVDPDFRDELQKWLSDWHAANPLLELASIEQGTSRKLIVPMNIATIDIVQTVKLSLGPESKSATPRVNVPTSCVLEFRFSRAWAGSRNPVASEPGSAALIGVAESFTYAIRPNTWLVAGVTRGTFSAFENQTYTVPLTMVPTSTGLWSLPGVDVAPTSAVSQPTSTDVRAAELPSAKVVYRTDLVSALEKVRVLPEDQVTVVEVRRPIPADVAVMREMSVAESVSQVY